jgi:hypothetical protein
MNYSINFILLNQEVLNRELLKNDKEQIVKFFLKNVWSGKIKLRYKLEPKIKLNKLIYHKSVPPVLKNISKVFYAWGHSITTDYLNEMKKSVVLNIDILTDNKVNLTIRTK